MTILSELVDESLSFELMSPTRRILLFQTNVGHACKLMDEILVGHATILEPKILMSDAMGSNQVHDIAVINALWDGTVTDNMALQNWSSSRHSRTALRSIVNYLSGTMTTNTVLNNNTAKSSGVTITSKIP